MARPKKTEQLSTVDTSTTEPKMFVIIPGSTTMTESHFQLTDPETGQRIATANCDNAHYAKQELLGNEAIKSLLKSRHGEIEIKFIDETEYTFEELMELENEFYSQTGLSDESAPAEEFEENVPAQENEPSDDQNALDAAQIADDEQKEGGENAGE